MRRHVHRLLCTLGLATAVGLATPGSASAQSLACEKLAQQATNLRDFGLAAEVYAQMGQRPSEASALLLCMRRSNPGLAEALMLFKRRLLWPTRTQEQVEEAFLHYVVNASQPLLDEGAAAQAERLARQYRESLLLEPQPDADAQAECGPPPWTLPMLRCIGQKANSQRYGRGDVVPVKLLDFEDSAVGYSTINATWMSEMSALAYWGPGLIDEQLRRWGYTGGAQIADPESDTFAFIARKGPFLVLSFRGTSGWKNILTDAKVRRVSADWAQGTVHRGFKGALGAVWPQIVQRLGRPQDQRSEILLTGHSLGAALAQLAALRLSQEGYRVRSVYTFGTPRVGDQTFVSDYDRRLGARSFPHVNDQDLVTRVPPRDQGYLATAQASTWIFTGSGHDMKRRGAEPADAAGDSANWIDSALSSISRATEFLPAALRPRALRPPAPTGPPSFNVYSNTFAKGPLDDHGSYEYLFKLVCAAIDNDLWPVEFRQSAAAPGVPPSK